MSASTAGPMSLKRMAGPRTPHSAAHVADGLPERPPQAESLPRFRRGFSGAWLLAGILLASPAFAQDSAVFRSGVSLVRVDAEVSRSGGDIVTDLRQSDFRITENGREQKLVNFSFEEDPLDVILLFDTGGDVKGKIHTIIRSVELGFHELRPKDRADVMLFAGYTAEVQPFTSNFSDVNDAILLKVLKQNFGGPSKVALAADDAAKRFRTEPHSQRRRAVLIVTGKTAGHGAEDAKAVRDLWQSDAVASELIPGGSAGSEDAIVEQTGGSAIAAGTDPGAAFQESLRRLRRRYSLYYVLPEGAAGSERHIKVELTPEAMQSHPGAKVFARRGYVAP
ncbi:MAG: hypothetical protein KGN84_05335 [Acidobacteriota bacterium]|nr:hypothetical protein [Acidobacteriota bacterium]